MIREWFQPDDGFDPVSRGALIGWVVCYALFLLYAAADTTGFLFIDLANLMIHEAGHLVFSWGGHYIQILGGTLAELLVPLLCGLAFVRRGATTAVAFCVFWTAENLLYIAAYMGDARRAERPLVGGDESDWAILFSHWGVLHLDRTIATWTRAFGWIGMLAAIGWLGWMYLRSEDRRAIA